MPWSPGTWPDKGWSNDSKHLIIRMGNWTAPLDSAKEGGTR